MASYAHSDPYDHGYLQVSSIHKIFYEQYGKQDGKTALFVHGGPGASFSRNDTTFFDPAVYRVVLFDQRGSGRSEPSAEIHENTTQLLIADIEALRTKLGIDKWFLVFGGSWGSTLSLLYAQSYPHRVGSLILRGIFLFCNAELVWTEPVPGQGVSQIFPEAYEEYVAHLSEGERHDPMAGYHKLLTSTSYETRLAAARASMKYGAAISFLKAEEESSDEFDDEKFTMHFALILDHYKWHHGFIEEGQILRKENIDKIRHIPTVIVQGRYDILCPPASAWNLYKAWPETKLIWTHAGHAASEPETYKQLVQACDQMAARASELL